MPRKRSIADLAIVPAEPEMRTAIPLAAEEPNCPIEIPQLASNGTPMDRKEQLAEVNFRIRALVDQINTGVDRKLRLNDLTDEVAHLSHIKSEHQAALKSWEVKSMHRRDCIVRMLQEARDSPDIFRKQVRRAIRRKRGMPQKPPRIVGIIPRFQPMPKSVRAAAAWHKMYDHYHAKTHWTLGRADAHAQKLENVLADMENQRTSVERRIRIAEEGVELISQTIEELKHQIEDPPHHIYEDAWNAYLYHWATIAAEIRGDSSIQDCSSIAGDTLPSLSATSVNWEPIGAINAANIPTASSSIRSMNTYGEAPLTITAGAKALPAWKTAKAPLAISFSGYAPAGMPRQIDQLDAGTDYDTGSYHPSLNIASHTPYVESPSTSNGLQCGASSKLRSLEEADISERNVSSDVKLPDDASFGSESDSMEDVCGWRPPKVSPAPSLEQSVFSPASYAGTMNYDRLACHLASFSNAMTAGLRPSAASPNSLFSPASIATPSRDANDTPETSPELEEEQIVLPKKKEKRCFRQLFSNCHIRLTPDIYILNLLLVP